MTSVRPSPATRASAWPATIGGTVLLLLTLLGAPAPTGVGAIELAIVALVGLAVMWGVATAFWSRSLPFDGSQALGLVAFVGYLFAFILSVVVGAARGAPYASVFRAVIPYLLFVPLALVGVMRREPQGFTRGLIRAFVVVGLVHAAYLLGLYVSGVQDLLDAQAVLLGRTTFRDPRTTLALFFAPAVLPLYAVVRGRWRTRLGAAVVIGVAVLGGLSTQTRAQVLAIACAHVSFFLLYSVWDARMRGRSTASALARFARMVGLATAGISALVAAVPALRVLAMTLVLRSRESFDNGRIDDEWLPAIAEVLRHDLSGVLVGIGTGMSFITATGEERTYVHNFVLYLLLYNGAIGLVLVAGLYVVLFAALVQRAFARRAPEYLACAALLVALFVYSQFFAVHKLLSYNAMIGLLGLVALGRTWDASPVARG